MIENFEAVFQEILNRATAQCMQKTYIAKGLLQTMVDGSDLGVIFAYIGAIVVLVPEIMGQTDISYLLHTVVIGTGCMLGFVYMEKLLRNRREKDTALIGFLLLGTYSLSLIASGAENEINLLATIVLSLIGTFFLLRALEPKKIRERARFYNSKQIKRDDRKTSIDKELSDPWKENPHLIYEEEELKKFDI